MYIQVKNESRQALDHALQKFSKMVKESGMMEDLKKHEHFTKKSVKLKQKRNKAYAKRITALKKEHKRNRI